MLYILTRTYWRHIDNCMPWLMLVILVWKFL
jgi:hypothetical protein